jgi:hypothetical protein
LNDHPPEDVGEPNVASNEPPAAQSPGSARATLSATEIEERLTHAVSGVEFKSVTLAALGDFVGELAGVPVSIDDAALKKIGKSRQSKLAIKLADTTAGDVLRAGAAKLGLVCTVRDGRVIITASGPSEAK